MFSRILRAASLRQFRSVPQRPQLARAVLFNQRRTFLGQPSGQDGDKAQEMMSRFMQSEEWKKIAGHPPAVEAIQKFMEVVKGKGLGLSEGKAPGMKDIMKLAMDADFRSALQNMKTEIKNAGVDLEDPLPDRDVDMEVHEDTPVEEPPAPSNRAKEHPLPQTHFYSVEYPGYVKEASVPKAIENLGGQRSIDRAFKRMASKTESLLELQLHPGKPFSHPIPGDVVNTNNLLLKVTRRRRKAKDGMSNEGIVGEYKAEVVGVVSKTVRFRSMADFQYTPDMNDPISKLRLAMDNMDVEAISKYRVARESDTSLLLPSEDVQMALDPSLQAEGQAGSSTEQAPEENLRLFPPPLFSRQAISQGYNFKANSASILTTTIEEETGEERKRLINKMRWKGYGPASIMFADTQVPTKPPDAVEKARDQANPKLLTRLQEFFEQRPIWTRMSLFNQFTALEAREILNSKVILPLVCYVFQDGPWRDTLVKFSYDPRTDNNARFFQRLYFRNANHPISRPSITTRRQDRVNVNLHIRNFDQDDERKKSHIFDGKTVSKETAAFQLCDIVDPMLREMIDDPEGLRETCDERDGWYNSHAFDRIKTVLRHKFFSVLEGHPATDEECIGLLASNEHSTSKSSSLLHRNTKVRAGKHNMAKGALRPEDAAAIRLRATLDRNVKSFTQRGVHPPGQ
ncbi:RNA polymerase III transcription factor IIIC subunit-domain-containing protein [Coprinopsis sp. MPI-PUGE-AT-0042]|nr:RNA polymerase III transcription factor IIIC subunit-domain-containing protein [Coprinopsis sp. MPI-PUGE-AT-0042]